MKTMSKIATAVAALSVAAVPASQAFAASKTENALIGAALGALGGALVSKGSTGVMVGAAAGAAIGLATDKPDRRDRYGRRITSSRSYAPAYNGYSNSRYYSSGYDGGRYGYGQAYPTRYYGR